MSCAQDTKAQFERTLNEVKQQQQVCAVVFARDVGALGAHFCSVFCLRLAGVSGAAEAVPRGSQAGAAGGGGRQGEARQVLAAGGALQIALSY